MTMNDLQGKTLFFGHIVKRVLISMRGKMLFIWSLQKFKDKRKVAEQLTTT